MYLQKEIEDGLWSVYGKLHNTKDASKQVQLLTPVLKKYGVKIRLVKSHTKKWNVRGFYDPHCRDILITLECGDLNKTHIADKKFLFNINCTVQHELIHQYQWQFRDPNIHCSKKYKAKSFRQEYLSDYDEIETQAHDLAMEIKFFYPDVNPMLVLSKYFNNEEVYLPTLNSYMKAFDCDMAQPAMRRLIRKLFVWLPLVEIYKPITHITGE